MEVINTFIVKSSGYKVLYQCRQGWFIQNENGVERIDKERAEKLIERPSMPSDPVEWQKSQREERNLLFDSGTSGAAGYFGSSGFSRMSGSSGSSGHSHRPVSSGSSGTSGKAKSSVLSGLLHQIKKLWN